MTEGLENGLENLVLPRGLFQATEIDTPREETWQPESHSHTQTFLGLEIELKLRFKLCLFCVAFKASIVAFLRVFNFSSQII